MITTLMLYALAIGVLVAFGALVLDRAARAATLSQRFTWLGALVLLAALTLAAPWRMAPAVAAAEAVALSAIEGGASVSLPMMPWHERTLSAVQSTVAGGIGAVGARVPTSVDRVLGVAWGVSALLLLALLIHLLLRLDAQRRRWPRAQLLGTSVRVGDREGPAVYGLFTPDIVIPRALLTRSTSDQALVLAHEDEHRRAHDPLLLAVAAALVALMPWHPIAWWCLSRLRLATELDCDARVLRRGVSMRQYGEVLLTLAASLPVVPRAAHALGLFDSRPHLERRLLAMTTPVARRSPFAVGGFALVGAVLFAAACNTDVPTAAEVRDADVAAVTKTLGLPSTPGAVAYVVDGAPSSAEEARAIPAGEILTIEVQRATGTAGANEVHIRTRDAAAGTMAEVALEATSTPTTNTITMVRIDSSTLSLARLAGGAVDSIAMQGDSIVRFESARVILRKDGLAGDTVRALVARRPYTVDEQPGEGRIIVRGTQLEPAATPLIIIDGVIVDGPDVFQQLKPEQIASIEVIKGDAAKRLHGTRGANGVIKVTTKP